MTRPRISVCTPAHRIPETEEFLRRIRESLDSQSFRDFEWVVTYEGKMAENSNAAIKKAKGEIIKILYMDDYLYSPDALMRIDQFFDGNTKWAVSGCIHNNESGTFNPHYPSWSDRIKEGANTIGSPSVLAFVNDDPLLFDETLSWVLDCDLYQRLYERYGEPVCINSLDVGIGIGPHQTTNLLTTSEKQAEFNYLTNKYV